MSIKENSNNAESNNLSSPPAGGDRPGESILRLGLFIRFKEMAEIDKRKMRMTSCGL